jgi:hypothetical protein
MDIIILIIFLYFFSALNVLILCACTVVTFIVNILLGCNVHNFNNSISLLFRFFFLIF